MGISQAVRHWVLVPGSGVRIPHPQPDWTTGVITGFPDRDAEPLLVPTNLLRFAQIRSLLSELVVFMLSCYKY